MLKPRIKYRAQPIPPKAAAVPPAKAPGSSSKARAAPVRRKHKAETKEAKAAGRQARKLQAPAGSDLTELELRTVGKATRQRYSNAYDEFKAWPRPPA